MKNKKTAVVALTKNGKDLGLKLKNSIKKSELFCLSKFKSNKENKEEINYFDSSLSKLTADLFESYENIIYIMSLGIVVRIIAPYLENKKVDPAVITIDESGENVISTLSGHLGGANKLTKKVAKILKSNPIITTATDCQKKPAIDLLAQKMNCIIKPFSNLKFANAALVNNRELNIFSDYPLPLTEAENINIYSLTKLNDKFNEDAFPVVVSNKDYNFKRQYLQLIPVNIIVGVGCRRGVEQEKINRAVNMALHKLNLNKQSIKKLATIDLKADEEGLLSYSKENNIDLEIIEREQIQKSNLTNISHSEFVKKTVGVPGVCEPAALLSSDNGKLVLTKNKFDKVTIALVEEEIKID